MRRGLQIVLSLLAIALLVHPFDCFAGARSREAMDCCMKGKCVPSAKTDSCCQNTVPASNHFVGARTDDYQTVVFAVALAPVSLPLPAFSIQRSDEMLRHPPPVPALNGRNLPLLI